MLPNDVTDSFCVIFSTVLIKLSAILCHKLTFLHKKTTELLHIFSI